MLLRVLRLTPARSPLTLRVLILAKSRRLLRLFLRMTMNKSQLSSRPKSIRLNFKRLQLLLRTCLQKMRHRQLRRAASQLRESGSRRP